MNADAFRDLYAYHFKANRKLWEVGVMALTDEQFTQEIAYSIGSVRNHVVHMMSVDEGWFSDLRGLPGPEFSDAVHFTDRAVIREKWDGVEADMRAYLNALRDDMLMQPAFPFPETDNFPLWQVLIHVANHATDHRAQLLRLLNDAGAPTFPQDYIFHVMGRM